MKSQLTGGSASCIECSPGTYENGGRTGCTACATGKISGARKTYCTSCPAGKFTTDKNGVGNVGVHSHFTLCES